MFPADGWAGIRTVKGKHESYGCEGRTRVWHLDEKAEESGSLCEGFFKITQKLSFVITGVDKVMGKRVWKKADLSGDR